MRMEAEQIDKVVELMKEYHSHAAHGTFSERKVRLFLNNEVDNPKTYIAVNKDVTAILIYTIVPSPFSTQPLLQAVCFYSRTAGAGFRLLKESEKWIEKWNDIFEYKLFLTTGAEKAEPMLERYGMKKIGTIYELGERT